MMVACLFNEGEAFMKKLVVFLFAVSMALSAYAQNQLPEYRFASGRWGFSGDRLLQNDARAHLAKVNFRVPQSGAMEYDFNIRYEGGAEDGHGGVGIQLFSDTAYNGTSWGSGKSYLLWLNYDENPGNRNIPRGLSAQIYRSYSNTWMELVESVSLTDYEQYLTDENLSAPIPFKIEAYGDTGEIRIYDPTDPEQYFQVNVETRDVPLKGNWVAIRTNGLQASFALGL
jgi:hypothetical protein